MKPLDQLDDIQRAKLLFELFPAEIPGLVAFITDRCRTIREDVRMNRASWDDPYLSFDSWLNKADKVWENLRHFDGLIAGSAKLFSEQLFDRLRVWFTAHCLRLYAHSGGYSNPKFATMIHLLFG
ncbi:hypothetical protein LL912_12430 [Niabella sp. CC-SYL272]|uniref:hypothetical protein n=1 Tax=Niabella agricola TaxID=2891571 RepID=UPI001F25C74A|nr:hypothetical protein [Niabella agricola]MCF3109579.1 hypothetical protein [Niabella agricola]